jgi:hypothetical protein
MQERGLLEQEEEVDDLHQRAFALDAPPDLVGLAQLPWAERQPCEFRFRQAALQNELREDLTRLGAGLVDVVRERLPREPLDALLVGEERAAFGSEGAEFGANGADLFVGALQRQDDRIPHQEAQCEHAAQGADRGQEDAFASIHHDPPPRRAPSKDASSAGRGGGRTFARSSLSLAGTTNSTVDRNS